MLGIECGGDRSRKAIAIDGKRGARRQLICVGGLHNQRAKPAHLGMEETDRAALRVVGAERVRTNELGQLRGLVDRGRTGGAHFMQDDTNPPARQLPSGLATRESASDDVNRAHLAKSSVKWALLFAQTVVC